MSYAKLKKCPFCGGKAEVNCSIIKGMDAIYWVECMQCNVSFRQNIRYTKREAIAMWNEPRIGEKGSEAGK